MRSSFYFYANPYQQRGADAALALAEAVRERGGRVFTDQWLADRGVGEACAMADMPDDIRALIAFGGDGTLLHTVQETLDRDLPLLGVHTGTVGFLMNGRADDPKGTAEKLVSGAFDIRRYPLLRIRYDGKEYFALNDLSLTRGEHPGVIEVQALADGETVFHAHGDGAVVSTPLGATAYGLSAGGPVIRPDTACLLLVPLCARELLLRPVILPLGTDVTLLAHGRDRRRLQLAIDGQILLPVTQEARICVGLADKQARLIILENNGFFNTLRKKQAVWNQQEERE